MESAVIKLGIVFGHFPNGLVISTRSICRNRLGDSFSLCRKQLDGLRATTFMHSFGNYHYPTTKGPIPASLVEFFSLSSKCISTDVLARMHAVSVGFPILGESQYIVDEKFYNPVLQPPSDIENLLLQNWIDSCNTVINEDLLSGNLIKFKESTPLHSGSRLLTQIEKFQADFSAVDFLSENSACAWNDHPRSHRIRRDRYVERH